MKTLEDASPWQRGSNKNANGPPLRQYFQGNRPFDPRSAELERVAHELNNTPRQTLACDTPVERLTSIVAATKQVVSLQWPKLVQ